MDQKVPNPEAKIEKLLKRLIKLFHEVLLHFDMDELKVESKKTAEFQAKLASLKEKQQKFANKEIFFDNALEDENARKFTDIIKQCFWLNSINYATLSRILELILVKRSQIIELNDINMYVVFSRATKVTVLGEQLNLGEILKCMLRQTDFQWIDSPFAEEGVRTMD